MPREQQLASGQTFTVSDDATDEQVASFLESRGLSDQAPDVEQEQAVEEQQVPTRLFPRIPGLGKIPGVGGALRKVGDVFDIASKGFIRGTFRTARLIGFAKEAAGGQAAQALNGIVNWQSGLLVGGAGPESQRFTNPFEGEGMADTIFGPVAESAALAPKPEIRDTGWTRALVEGRFDVLVEKFADGVGEATPSFAATLAAYFVAGPVGAGLVGGGLEGASQFEQAITNEETLEEALKQGRIVAGGAVVLNAIPFVRPLHRFLPVNKAGVAGTILLDAIAEGTTETLEGGLDPIAKLQEIPKTREGLVKLFTDIRDGVWGESGAFVTAAFMGGIGINPARRYRTIVINDVIDTLEKGAANRELSPPEQAALFQKQLQRVQQVAADNPEASLLDAMQREEELSGFDVLPERPQIERVEGPLPPAAPLAGEPGGPPLPGEGAIGPEVELGEEGVVTPAPPPAPPAPAPVPQQVPPPRGSVKKDSVDAQRVFSWGRNNPVEASAIVESAAGNDGVPVRSVFEEITGETGVNASGRRAFADALQLEQQPASERVRPVIEELEASKRLTQGAPIGSYAHPDSAALIMGDHQIPIQPGSVVGEGEHVVFQNRPDMPIQLMAAAQRLKAIARSSTRLERGVSGLFSAGQVDVLNDRLRYSGAEITLEDIRNSRSFGHEVGHAIDHELLYTPRAMLKRIDGKKTTLGDRFGDSFIDEGAMIEELRRVSFDISRPLSPEDRNSPNAEDHINNYRMTAEELIADYMTVYFHDPNVARENAPLFTQKFEEKLQSNSEIRAVVEETVTGKVAPVMPVRPDQPMENPVQMPGTIPPRAFTLEPGSEPTAKLATMDIIRDQVRTFKAKTRSAYIRANGWINGNKGAGIPPLSERQLNDVGAFVEGVPNLQVRGDTAEAVSGRMTDRMKQVVNEYRFFQELARQEINTYLADYGQDEYIAFLENYLAHFYVPTDNNEGARKSLREWAKDSPNAKKRKLPTLQEAVAMGRTPITQDAAKLYKMWADVNWKVATNIGIIADLKNVVTEEGNPAIAPRNTAPTGYSPYHHPAINRVFGTKTKTGATILREGPAMVHPDLVKVLDTVLSDPFSNKWVNKMNLLNGISKKMQLSFSLFHHLSLTESAQAVLARTWNPIRGLLVIGEKGQPLITQPHRIGARIMDNDPDKMEDAVMSGLEAGPSSDAFVTQFAKTMANTEARLRASTNTAAPLARVAVTYARKFNERWDKALWDRYHAGLKVFSWDDMVGEFIKRNPQAGASELRTAKQAIAAHINNAFGGQEWETKFWSNPKTRQVLQWSMLAPDWTLSNLNIAASGVEGIAQAIAPGSTQKLRERIGKATGNPEEGLRPLPDSVRNFKRDAGIIYWRNMIPTLWASAAGLQAAIYYAFGDDDENDTPWIWENEPGKTWDIDVTPIFRNMGLKEADENSQRYYVHFGKQARETMGWFEHPVQTLFGKSSPVVHTAIEQTLGVESLAFGEPFNTQWIQDEKQGLETIPGRASAIASKFIPMAFGGSNFAFAAPLSKGMTRWKGQRAYEQAFEAYADPGIISGFSKNIPNYTSRLDTLVEDITEAAQLNGHDSKTMMQAAAAVVRGRVYRRFLEAVERGDLADMEEFADQVVRLGASVDNIQQSAARRGIDLTRDDSRAIRETVRGARRRIRQ